MDETLASARSDVTAFATRPVFGLSDGDLNAAIRDAHTLASTVTGVLASLIHEAQRRDLPRRHDAVSVVAWLRDLLRISPAEARSLVNLGTVLDERPAVADAVMCGRLNAGQAAAIGRVLADVPSTEPMLIDKVEAALLDEAARFEPIILHRLGDRILAHVNPEVADVRLRERLEREQREARQRRGFTLSSDGRGGVRFFGRLDAEGAAIVSAALEPWSRPVRDATGSDLRTPAARRVDALVDVCRVALASGGLPDNGGQPPQLNVTVDFEALRRGIAVGHLDTGAQLSPDTVRRLACQAQILPAVLDGAAVPIDIGRARRLYAGQARQAVLLRDGGCAFPGCDRPPRWCQIHHVVPWSAGGRTDRDNGVALCGYHHRLIHRSDWIVRLGADLRPEFIPPSHLDEMRRPQRNPYHLRR